MTSLVVGSGSPRRHELFRRVGISFDIDIPEIDESVLSGEAPADYVRRVAGAKADLVAARQQGRCVLTADTIVSKGATILGKPTDSTDAARMLNLLCGHEHAVTTVVVVVTPSARELLAVSTRVHMLAQSPAAIDAYLASGEWQGKAGGYAIQGIAAAFVSQISGSVTNVIGLPLAETIAVLERLEVCTANFAVGEPA